MNHVESLLHNSLYKTFAIIIKRTSHRSQKLKLFYDRASQNCEQRQNGRSQLSHGPLGIALRKKETTHMKD